MVEVRPTLYQIDDLVKEINKRVANHERTLVVTLTIKMSEDLTKSERIRNKSDLFTFRS